MKSKSVRWLLLPSISIIVLLVIFSPTALLAQTGQGLVPCGPGTSVAKCEFCHFFVLIQNVYKFLMFTILPPLAILSVAIAGFLWFTSAGNQNQAGKAIAILKAVVVGLVVAYAAWLVINFVITLIARNTAIYNPGVWYNPQSWFNLSCPTT